MEPIKRAEVVSDRVRKTLTVEHLGRRGRVVLAAIEDAYVNPYTNAK